MTEQSELESFRAKWSEKLSITFWGSVLLSAFALLVLIVAVAIPNTLGTDHKIYIIGVVGAGLLCIIVLLIKARRDSSSLLIWTKVSDIIAAFIIGITVGQLTRHITIQN
jgi:hypothetical protein